MKDPVSLHFLFSYLQFLIVHHSLLIMQCYIRADYSSTPSVSIMNFVVPFISEEIPAKD